MSELISYLHMSIKSIHNILTYVVSFGLFAFLLMSAFEYTKAFLDTAVMAQIGKQSFFFYAQFYVPVVLYAGVFGYSMYLYRKTKEVYSLTLAPLVWLVYGGVLIVFNYFASFGAK